MKLPSPYEIWGNCLWLPRIIAKARLLAKGELPPDYAARFGQVDGVDGQFLSWFGLSPDEIRAMAIKSDEGITAWFLALPQASALRIEEWNHHARNLGRPGFPMAERLPLGKATVYAHIDSTNIDNVLDLIVADEQSNY